MATKKNSPVKPNDELFAALREFIRTEGSTYLKDPNVSSIGIGYKIVDGKPTSEVSIQFTVASKAEPDALEALGTELLPETIEVAGVEVPTDVLERTYQPGFKVVTEAVPNDRKVRVDPVRPGVSVGHPTITAGTVGVIVYDIETAQPCVLSNWHVLHGNRGKLGDIVVQPGPHDDNRTDTNRVGPLMRSHLGVAGDGAVAAVEDRNIDPKILELEVAPEELGEPELGDKVVKSGRTTGVTHGIVRRIDTIVKLNYGLPAGVVEVGCFEIGIDSANRPIDDEVSRGGDSGAAWVFKSGNGRPSRVLAGLHFAGEGEGEPDEHALACLPRSIFEKLGITLIRPEAAATGGYDPAFLNVELPVPELDSTALDDAALLDGSPRIDYTHFSLTMSRDRKFPHWVAWNIDGGGLKKIDRDGIPFIKDPRLPADIQTGDELYRDNRLDRGHVARRADLVWGSMDEAEQANRDSFFFTNITPQMDDFNQRRDGLWGRLEDAVFADVEVEDLRVSVFGGPVFGSDDRVFRGVRIPHEFWKVIAFVHAGELKASAFLLTQSLDQLEALELDEFRVFQASFADLEGRTKVRFPSAMRQADTFGVRIEQVEAQPPLTSLSDIVWI